VDDLPFVAVTLLFFALALAYIRACAGEAGGR